MGNLNYQCVRELSDKMYVEQEEPCEKIVLENCINID